MRPPANAPIMLAKVSDVLMVWNAHSSLPLSNVASRNGANQLSSASRIYPITKKHAVV